jgi:hypothetical protein
MHSFSSRLHVIGTVQAYAGLAGPPVVASCCSSACCQCEDRSKVTEQAFGGPCRLTAGCDCCEYQC